MSQNSFSSIENMLQTPTNSSSSMNIVLYFKVISFLIIISVSLIFGLIPLYSNSCRKSSKLLGLANAFSGGLFMGIGLFHLLPEAGENFEKYYLTPEGKNSFIYGQPLSFFIAFISYSLILFLEKVAFNSHALTSHTHANEDNEVHEHIHKHFNNNNNELNEPLLLNNEENINNLKKNNQNNNNINVQNKDLADEFFINNDDNYNNNKKYKSKDDEHIYHNCFSVYYKNYKKPFDNLNIKKFKSDTNFEEDEIDSEEDENILKNVVSSKGQFASFLQARNMSKNYI